MRNDEYTHDQAPEPAQLTAERLQRSRSEAKPARLLIVEDDHDLARVLADHLAETLRLDVTVAGSCREAVEVEMTTPQDLILADLLLPDGDAIGLQRQLRGLSAASFVLMSGSPTINRLIEAMRLGAMDFLVKPFDLSQMTLAVSDALARHKGQSQAHVRYLRMRQLARRILKDRRELRGRVDLVCRDLVQAYRRLARRVVELYELYGHQPNS